MLRTVFGLIVGGIVLGIILVFQITRYVEDRRSKPNQNTTRTDQTMGNEMNLEGSEIQDLITRANNITGRMGAVISKMRLVSEILAHTAQAMNDSSETIHASKQRLATSVKTSQQSTQGQNNQRKDQQIEEQRENQLPFHV